MSDTLDAYKPPSEPSESPDSWETPRPEVTQRSGWRLVAGGFAVLMTVWEILAGLLLLAGGWRAIIGFAPGFFLMCGYYWRAFGRPTLLPCRIIWSGSLLVHSGWLTFVIYMTAKHGGPLIDSVFTLVMITWWSTSAIASFAGLALDRGSEPQKREWSDPDRG